MKLYFSRNLNPRLAVAAARFLELPIEFEFASPFSPGEREKFLKLNPNLSVPILVEGERTLWEADAIACRLSQLADSDFWPVGDSLPDLVRWISWGYWNFVRACDRVHFERVTKQRYRLGPVRQDVVELGLSEFASSAAILEEHLGASDWLVGSARHLRRFPCRLCPPVRGPRRPAGSRIFRASKPECAADGYPSLAGSVRGAGRARTAASPDGRGVGRLATSPSPRRRRSSFCSAIRLRRSREQQALPRCARAATTRMRKKRRNS